MQRSIIKTATTATASMNRRHWLRQTGASTLGLGASLPFTTSTSASIPRDGQAKSCIVVWLDGGPSHLETFDPKPDAPSEVRGPLGTVGTRLPGVRVSECLPGIAKRIDRFALIRSVTSPLGEHNFGAHYLLTGYRPTPAVVYPTHGSVTAHLRSLEHEAHKDAGDANRSSNVLPAHIAIPNFAVGGSKLSGNGFLPSSTRPFSVGGDPAARNFQVRDLEFYPGLNLERLDQRRQIAAAMNQFSRARDAANEQGDNNLERAFQLITSSEAKKAFDIRDEAADARSKYGAKSIGGCCLLARRLVERGVPFVTINNRGWDTHDDLVTRLRDGYSGAQTPVGLAPSLDQALSALTDDLSDRGLLEQTLVVVMGEFGRTPKLNTRGGRDHWPRVFSVVMAGGGVQGGQVVGASDAVGEQPQDRPVTPSDLAATIYHAMGIDPATEVRTPDGRPIRITPPEAGVIDDVL